MSEIDHDTADSIPGDTGLRDAAFVSDAANAPFFVLGCVRSGTTLLRNILCLHPRLESPEETHFFRWSEPFGTPAYEKNYKAAELFARHRNKDGIPNFDFHFSLALHPTRAAFMSWYCGRYMEGRNPEGRWFEKTPQHVYNLLLLAEAYPEAKFIHVVRNPLNVVVSLMRGEVLPIHDVRGAANYWLEAAMIVSQYRKLAPQRVLEVRYEDLIREPEARVASILEFIGERVDVFPFKKMSGLGSAKTVVRKRKLKDDYTSQLTAEQVAQVLQLTEPYFSAYGYEA